MWIRDASDQALREGGSRKPANCRKQVSCDVISGMQLSLTVPVGNPVRVTRLAAMIRDTEDGAGCGIGGGAAAHTTASCLSAGESLGYSAGRWSSLCPERQVGPFSEGVVRAGGWWWVCAGAKKQRWASYLFWRVCAMEMDVPAA